MRSALLVATVLSLVPGLRAEEARPPIQALLITGGCCHDYAYQAKRLAEGSRKRANIEWTVALDPRKGTNGKIDLYENPDWAGPYDIVVHNECFANTGDPEYVRKITRAHHGGVPAVVIHCAMHTYRAAKFDDWRELLGVTSRRHEHQSRYPVVAEARDHPVMAGFPSTWTSPRDELYVIEKVWPNTTVLATGKSERDGRRHAAFWVGTYGKARVFGTTFGHGNATFDDEVFMDTLTRGILWATRRITSGGEPSAGYEARKEPVMDWTREQLARLPKSEKVVELFNGKDLAGWRGMKGIWSVEDGQVVGRNTRPLPTSTYLFTEKSYREFRLLFEVRQTRSSQHSAMHSAVAALGERFDDKGNAFGFKGPLLMFCNDWGIWDAYRRNRTVPRGHRGFYNPEGVERVGQWNEIEILVKGDRIRFVANGRLVFDSTDEPEMLDSSPICLQIHSNERPQEFRFRGLVLTENPEDALVTSR